MDRLWLSAVKKLLRYTMRRLKPATTFENPVDPVFRGINSV